MYQTRHDIQLHASHQISENVCVSDLNDPFQVVGRSAISARALMSEAKHKAELESRIYLDQHVPSAIHVITYSVYEDKGNNQTNTNK